METPESLKCKLCVCEQLTNVGKLHNDTCFTPHREEALRYHCLYRECAGVLRTKECASSWTTPRGIYFKDALSSSIQSNCRRASVCRVIDFRKLAIVGKPEGSRTRRESCTWLLWHAVDGNPSYLGSIFRGSLRVALRFHARP